MNTSQNNRIIPSISGSLDRDEVDHTRPIIKCNVGGGVNVCGYRILKCINFYFLHSSCLAVKALEMFVIKSIEKQRIFETPHNSDPDKYVNPLADTWTRISPIILIFILAYTFSNKTFYLVRQSCVDILYSVYAILICVRPLISTLSDFNSVNLRFSYQILAGVTVPILFVVDIYLAMRYQGKIQKPPAGRADTNITCETKLVARVLEKCKKTYGYVRQDSCV